MKGDREFTAEEIKKVKRLIKDECCNYENGNCILLDDGEEHTCPQFVSRHLCCRWFYKNVLPMKSELCLALESLPKGVARCPKCDRLFRKVSNRRLYCEPCAKQTKKRQKADYMIRKRREK